MADDTLPAEDIRHFKLVAKYHEKEGRLQETGMMEHYWNCGHALVQLRELLPSQAFSKCLKEINIEHRRAYRYIQLSENFAFEDITELKSLREAGRVLANPEDDIPLVTRVSQLNPDSTAKSRLLHEDEVAELPQEPESEWWSGFDDDDPAVTDAEPTPDPAPELPADEVVWEDKQEQAEVLEPEEKRERLTRTDKLELRMDELETQNTELREANSDLAVENDQFQGQIRNFLNEDRHDSLRHSEVVRLQERVSILNGQCHDTAMKLKDAKGELRQSKSSVKSLLQERDGLRKRLGIST